MSSRTLGPDPTCRVPAGVCLMALALVLLIACSPTYNWRELRPSGTPLQALMPCKPESAERTVAINGLPAVIHMHSCEAGGQTFAVGWADVEDAARVPEVLAGWRAGALAAIRVDPSAAADAGIEWQVTVPGAQQIGGLQAAGQSPRGEAILMRGAYFARGTQVYQAAVYGATLADEALATFFEGLQLP